MENKIFFRILLTVLLSPILALAEVIQGTVVDSLTSQGILRAIVTEKGTSNRDTTDAQGRFSLTIGIGTEKSGVPARGAGFILSGGRFTWQEYLELGEGAFGQVEESLVSGRHTGGWYP